MACGHIGISSFFYISGRSLASPPPSTAPSSRRYVPAWQHDDAEYQHDVTHLIHTIISDDCHQTQTV
jgi:hypothetical protein